MLFIAIIEQVTGKKAIIDRKPMQLGDVEITFANIDKGKRLLDFQPSMDTAVGVARFILWRSNGTTSMHSVDSISD